MRAVAYKQPQPISAETSLIDIDLPTPEAKGHDLLVEVKAVSVNPVDVKVRASAAPPEGEYKILGWDAAGIVRAVGPEVTMFKPGDEVFYAGAINRGGSNVEFHLVDERIVGAKPKSLDFAAAAALPLTSITAYEALFDRLKVQDPVPGVANAILIIGGAGGVGSIAIQIARALTDLTVIATASRPETQAWVKELGAHHVIDHSKPLAPQIEALGIGAPAFIFSTTNTADHIASIVDAIAPQRIAAEANSWPAVNVARHEIHHAARFLCPRTNQLADDFLIGADRAVGQRRVVVDEREAALQRLGRDEHVPEHNAEFEVVPRQPRSDHLVVLRAPRW